MSDLKINDEFTVNDDVGQIELPDGGWLQPGVSYRVTYDKIEFVNRLVAEGKAKAGGAKLKTPDAGLSVEQMRKFKEEAKPVDADAPNPDDTVHPDIPREARNDARRKDDPGAPGDRDSPRVVTETPKKK